MILTRVGNKRRVADKIIPYFPQHDIFIEMFFGGGGMFFSKPLAKYNILNDNDDDVYNLFMVLKTQKKAFYRQLELLPITDSLFQYWRHNKETEPIMKALRFIMLSNFSYMGKMDTLRLGVNNVKSIALKNVDTCFEYIKDALLMCDDFRDVLKKIPERDRNDKAFIYCDPPYLGTENTYKSIFEKQDTADLFKILVESNIKFAISEFHNPFVYELAKHYNLNIIEIGERSNLKNKNTEILIVNYTPLLKKNS